MRLLFSVGDDAFAGYPPDIQSFLVIYSKSTGFLPFFWNVHTNKQGLTASQVIVINSHFLKCSSKARLSISAYLTLNKLLIRHIHMEDSVPKRVFLDNCIVSISETVQNAQNSATVSWGGKEHTVQVTGVEGKPLPRESEAWKRDQVECMPTIGRLARLNVITLYTYAETMFEGWKRSGAFHATNVGNVFNGVEFEYIDAAVERSYFFQSPLDGYSHNKNMVKFCKWLLEIDPDILIEEIAHAREFPDFLLTNLRGVKRYRELCKGLSEKQYPDAFHLWTAEVNGADCFLTVDSKFINVITETKKVDLPCPPLSPSQLLDQLGIHERDPIEYTEGTFYEIFGRHR